MAHHTGIQHIINVTKSTLSIIHVGSIQYSLPLPYETVAGNNLPGAQRYGA